MEKLKCRKRLRGGGALCATIETVNILEFL